MGETKERTKAEALARAMELFKEFDIDDDRYAGVFLMLDKKDERFRMIAINSNFEEIATMLDSAFDATIESVIDMDNKNRTLN